MTSYPLLSQSANWGSLVLPNRTFMPPMGTNMSSPLGTYSQVWLDFMLARARGGCGLLITESMPIQTSYDFIPGSAISLAHDDQVEPLQTVVNAIHAEGALVAVNITPGMGRVVPVAPDGGPSWSASDNTTLADPSVRCRELSTGQVEEILEDFTAGVRRALAAGFDAIDLHGHTGYLMDQFLSAAWNRRTDRFGGDVAGRATFATEMIRIVREVAGKDFPLSMRISANHHFPGGRELDEGRELAVILQDAGLDVLMIDAGSYEAIDWMFPPYYMGDGAYLPDVAAIKPALRIPVAVAGSLTPAVGEKALADGIADFIGFGRMLIADPELPVKALTGRTETIRPCIRCNQMCIGNVITGQAVHCAVNPQAGFEGARIIEAAAKPRKIVVVGGGPGGMEAARVAALRGHDVQLYERDSRLGGVLAPAATPDFKRELNHMIPWWEGELSRAGVSVHLNHAVTAEDAILRDADAVVLATGSKPWAPAITGLDSPIALEVIDAHQGGDIGKNVVVCGGGLSGADLALELAQDGHAVTIVEMASEIATDMVIYNRVSLLKNLHGADVTILTDHTVTAIGADSVVVKGEAGETTLPADTAILSFGVRPERALPEALADSGVEIHEVGDCVTPAKVAEAIHAGYLVGATL